jgi:hypothetical protein
MIKSVYAWAVVLLLTRLLLENVPAARKRQAVMPKASSLADQPSRQGYRVPIPVAVESRSRVDSS